MTQKIFNLYRSIRVLGFGRGIRYWRAGLFYQKHPEELPKLIKRLQWESYLAFQRGNLIESQFIDYFIKQLMS